VGLVRATASVLPATALALAMGGCGHLGSAENANAAKSALDFDRALQTPRIACERLAPGTLAELQDSSGPCPQSLPQEHLPVATTVVGVDVYGKDAMVRLDRDVVFLARFQDGWKVTAAGCTLQEAGRPYTCAVKGQ
jgi:hypothetical protein